MGSAGVRYVRAKRSPRQRVQAGRPQSLQFGGSRLCAFVFVPIRGHQSTCHVLLWSSGLVLSRRMMTSERSKCAEHLVVLPLSGQLVFAETLISGVPQRANRMKLLLPPPLAQRRQGLGQSIIGKGVLRIRDLVARCLRIGRLLRFLDRDHRGSRSREEKRGRIIGSPWRASHILVERLLHFLSDILGRPVGGNFRWTAR